MNADRATDNVQSLLLAASAAVSDLGRAQWDSSSPAAQEIAADAEWATEDFPAPAYNTHVAVSVYLQAAGDYLRGLAEISDPGINLAFSPLAVARGACETSCVAWWLGLPTIRASERVGRFLRVHRSSCVEERRLYESLGMDRTPTQDEEWARWARSQGYNDRSQMPKWADLFDSISERGRSTYRMLSTGTHAPLFALWGIWDAARQGHHDEIIQVASYEALGLNLRAADAVAALWARRIDFLDTWEAALAELRDGLEVSRESD